jgi:predicted alpha/beta hydrolase family esterase
MIVFIHGADGYAEDRALAESLELKLGRPVDYPRMPDTDDWSPALAEALHVNPEPIVVAHSAGGYQLLKYLAESGAPVRSIHLIAVPFPGGDADWTFDGFDLPDLSRLTAPVFLYASEDDEVVPFAHRDLWAAAIPSSVTRTTTGGHQLDGDLWVVADDIRSL